MWKTILSVAFAMLIAGASVSSAANHRHDSQAPIVSHLPEPATQASPSEDRPDRSREIEERWRLAAQSSDAARVKELLTQGEDINAPAGGALDEPPLFIVCAWGTVEMVSLLLQHGAEVNLTNRLGQTVLMRATLNGNSELVKFLLSHGADPNLRDNHGELALNQFGGHCLSRTALDSLINKTSATKEDLQRALLSAVGGGTCADQNIVTSLLAAGADVNWQNKSGLTALMQAAQWGHTEAVRLLLEKGADVSLRSTYGQTAQDVASTREVAKLIKKAARR